MIHPPEEPHEWRPLLRADHLPRTYRCSKCRLLSSSKWRPQARMRDVLGRGCSTRQVAQVLES